MTIRVAALGTALALALPACGTGTGASAPLRLVVAPEASAAAVPRVGANLGHWTAWGAEQLSANVLRNPGFEGTVDRALVVVAQVGAHHFCDDTAWLGRPDDFWLGGRYEVRTGAAAGAGGPILSSRRAGRSGLPEIVPDAVPPGLGSGDVVALTQVRDGQAPACWWVPESAAGRVWGDRGNPRPGSPGQQAAGLHPGGQLASYLDAIGDRAGKLLPVEGEWILSFWIRGEAAATLRAEFGRDGAAPLVAADVAVTEAWREVQLGFTGTDAGPAGILALRLRHAGGSGRIWIDDAYLGRRAERGQAFRGEVDRALAELRPGYLRDWMGQLGDTEENRRAGAWARRASQTRPGGPEAVEFGYSLPDFLDLCERVGARPWIVAPTTFGDAEWEALGRFLSGAAGAARFAEVVVEFGNENWNPLFRAAGIVDPAPGGLAADRAFDRLRGAAAGVNLVTAVNGQHANPDAALRGLRCAREAGLLAVAPYFMPRLTAGTPPAAALEQLFAGDAGRLAAIAAGARGSGREVAVSEVNLHTTAGDAGDELRTALTAGAAAGTALAATVLEALDQGARRQCVYVLSGYDAKRGDGEGFVRLWGLVRDLGPTCRLRPTGQAVALLNRVMEGQYHRLEGGGQALTAAAFRSARGWSAAVANRSGQALQLELIFPPEGALPRAQVHLEAPDALATNEDSLQVRPRRTPAAVEGRVARARIAPWGLLALVAADED
ncbi:MAG: hypothetical protein ABIL09_03305 [Gemmatimonadota bacterium]